MGLGDVAWLWTAFLSLLGEGHPLLMFGWLLWISEKRSKRTVNMMENQRLQGKDSAERGGKDQRHLCGFGISEQKCKPGFPGSLCGWEVRSSAFTVGLAVP